LNFDFKKLKKKLDLDFFWVWILDFLDFWIFFGFGFWIFWIFGFFLGFGFPIQIQSKNPTFFGFEPLDLTTKEYYRATNRKKFCTYQMLMHRLRIEHDENEEDFKLKTVVKRYKTSQLKKEIREEESKKSWIQFYVNGTILKNTDINLIGTNNSSVKVIILFFFILFNRFFDIKPKIEKKEAH
jgi:hypothetical protein